MQLIKMEHPDKGIWYATNLVKAAKYMGITYNSAKLVIYGAQAKCKNWTLEFCDDDNVINKYIIG